ncbi:MAG TPA: VOC family protein [Solirubrobacterales bacterium]|nr:VOC family protein [Solirubrobacterales bacterium]
MLAESKAYNGFAVDDVARARQFYEEVLGIPTETLDEENGLIVLKLGGGRDTLVYRKEDHVPATYTVLNFPVEDVDATVDGLTERGVSFERYDQFPQDERGIVTEGGPRVAWFKDPAGNILSVLAQPDQ